MESPATIVVFEVSGAIVSGNNFESCPGTMGVDDVM
jgi:hypothetical protein